MKPSGRVRYGVRPWLWLLVWGAGVAAVAGCSFQGPVSKDVMIQYVDAKLADAEILPATWEANTRPKVLVVDGDDGVDSLARQSRLGASLSQAVTLALSERGVEVVDNSQLSPQLAAAIRTAEALGSSSYSGPEVAAYAIKPVVGRSEYAAPYSAPINVPDKKGNILFTIPGGFKHTAAVAATVRIYELPSMRLLTTLNVKGSASRTEAQTPANSSTGAALLRSAAAHAVANSKAALLDFFGNKGYVEAKRQHEKDKKTLFRITLGSLQGLKPGDSVGLFTLRPGLDGESEELLVVRARVSANILANSSWVEPEDEQKAKRVRRGDVVRPQIK